jgi:mediator of RNA polymerase II transcription subunit 13
VQYHVYAVDKKDGSRADKEEVPLEDILASLGSQLRARRYLTFIDPARRALWIFRGGSDTGFADGPLDEGFAEPVREISLKCECFFALINGCVLIHLSVASFQGSLKATELSQCFSRHPMGNNAPPTPTGISPSTPTAALRAAQMANLRAFHQNTGTPGALLEPAAFPPTTDVRTIYSLFMNAVSSTISYHLARHHNTFPLGSRTFVALSKSLTGEVEDAPSALLKPFTLDIYLTAGGNLVISTGIDHHYNIRILHDSPEDVSSVYLAVGGLSAELLGQPPSSSDAETLAWKDLVKEKLELKGIHLAEIDSDVHWLLVRACPTSMDTSGDALALSSVVFYWPAALCFYDDRVSSHQGRSGHLIANREEIAEIDASSWFSAPQQGGFIDPLRFAEDWFHGKAERDRTIEERRRKQRDVEAAQKQVEGAALSVPSPFYTRGDLQSAGGVYPTPPDGLPQASSASNTQDVPAIAGATVSARPSVDYQSGEGMDLDINPFTEGVKLRGPSVISRGSMQLDASMNLSDDLFGDMDEDDDFVGNDITDADFSFFDEPDLVDDMADPSSAAAVPPDDEVDPPADNDSKDVENEGKLVDPVTTPSQDLSQALVLTEAKDSAPPVPTTNLVVREMSADQKVSPKEIVDIKSPLSPTSVRHKLFEFAIDEVHQPQESRRHSTFDPVAFNSRLGINDAKYTMDGAFSFVPPESNALKRPSDQVFNINLPPKTKRARIGPATFPGGQLIVTKQDDWDSDQSSVISDASDEDSLTEFGSMSLAASPMKMYQDKRLWELQDEEATSVATSPGNYMMTDDGYGPGMTGTRKVCAFNLHKVAC